MQPTADEQVQFLRNIQRLLGEGLFVATYKYALLLALADICVEHGDDSGCPLVVPTTLIAEKFISYYWRQTLPYVARATTHPSSLVLRQNTGKPAAVVRLVENARNCIEPSLLKCASRHEREWTRLVLRVDAVIRRMPLWKLQTVGRATLDFLYANRKHGTLIELRAGVAFCFRQFYGLIGDLVGGACAVRPGTQ